MRHIKKIFAIAGIAMATFISQSALANTCKVTDPTDTPLNARQTPNGKIIGSVKNNTIVIVLAYDYDNKGRPWALIFDAKDNRYLGWVFREFISCYPA